MTDNYLELYNARDGTSQRTRLDKNLLPESFQIDGRTSVDLLNFAIKFSESLIYYDHISGTRASWKNFFVKDRYVVIYIIANSNLYQEQKSFYTSFESMVQLTDRSDIQSQFHKLIDPFFKVLNILATWDSFLGFNDFTDKASVNISQYFYEAKEADDDDNDEKHIVDGIRRIYQICLFSKWSDDVKGDWQTIDTAFSLDLKSITLKDSDYFLLEDDLIDTRDTFAKIYRLAEGTINRANEYINNTIDETQNVKPHAALFYGFLKVYEILQSRINTITEKHLDYYYEEVLKFTRSGTVSDETHVQFDLNPDIRSHKLKEGTGVVAGKDASGKPIIYETVLRTTYLNNTRIKAIYSLFVSQNQLNYTGFKEDKQVITDIFYRKHDLKNSAEMRIFGEDQFYRSDSKRTMQNADVGFIIASEQLRLKEGERRICIHLIGSKESYDDFNSLINEIAGTEQENELDTFTFIFRTAFDLFITLDGKETLWDYYSVRNDPGSNGITLEIALSSDDPPVNALQNMASVNQPSLKSPYVKVMLKDESHIYAFPLMQVLDIVNIKLSATVEGLKDFLLFNNYGQIDHSIPFNLFGAVPKLHSYFLIGSPEVFSKPVKKINVNLNWYQLPIDPEGWTGYFTDYDEAVSNNDFKVNIEYLHSGVWEGVNGESDYPLFEEEVLQNVKLKRLSQETHFNKLELAVDPSVGFTTEDFQPYTLNTRNGYLKMELVGPAFGFGFDAYHKNLYKSIKENAKSKEDTDLREPNPPVSPVVKSISLDYYSDTEAIGEQGPTHAIQLFSLGPFGYKERELVSTDKTNKLLLNFQPEGHCMIGLDSYPEGGIINLFFRSRLANVESFIRDIPDPEWYYLKNNNWEKIEPKSILFDSTRSFTQSGLVSISIPDSISNSNTLMIDQLFWIRASFNEHSKIAPEVLGIYTNVATVEWNGESDGLHLEKPLPIGSINKMQHLDPNVIKVEQVFDSYNGKVEETKLDYYTRVSERLRHKNRAVNTWDYERLVLDRFPFIFKVKCFNAIRYLDKDEESTKYIEPGSILIVVTPDISNPHIKNKNRPKLSINLLIRVRDYLQGLTSPFVNIDVRNPYYERIRVVCKVMFKDTRNTSYYLRTLNNDIAAHLTPWRYSDELDEQFGNSVFRSKVMSFVSSREYVDFVTSFSIVKTSTEGDYAGFNTADSGTSKNTDREIFTLYDTARQKENKEEIKPEFPWSILTSVREHDITVIYDDKYRSPVKRGIENMRLGVDFVITEINEKD